MYFKSSVIRVVRLEFLMTTVVKKVVEELYSTQYVLYSVSESFGKLVFKTNSIVYSYDRENRDGLLLNIPPHS